MPHGRGVPEILCARGNGKLSGTVAPSLEPLMPDYRRHRVPGGTYFFTVNLQIGRAHV